MRKRLERTRLLPTFALVVVLPGPILQGRRTLVHNRVPDTAPEEEVESGEEGMSDTVRYAVVLCCVYVAEICTHYLGRPTLRWNRPGTNTAACREKPPSCPALPCPLVTVQSCPHPPRSYRQQYSLVKVKEKQDEKNGSPTDRQADGG